MRIKEWFDGFQSQIDFILIGCGFSPHNEAQVEQTATEIRSKSQTTTDTIRLMKQLRLDQWTRVHDKALIIHGLWDGKGERPYTLSIPEEEVVDKAQQTEEALIKIQANLSNYVTEIAKMNNVNKQEAHNMFKENIEINSQAPSPSIQEGEDKNSGSKSSNNKEDKK